MALFSPNIEEERRATDLVKGSFLIDMTPFKAPLTRPRLESNTEAYLDIN